MSGQRALDRIELVPDPEAYEGSAVDRGHDQTRHNCIAQLLKHRRADELQAGARRRHGRVPKNARVASFPIVGTTSARSKNRLNRSQEHSAM
jgi:hypothetical protein